MVYVNISSLPKIFIFPPLILLKGHSSFGIVSLPGYSKTVTVCMIHASTKFGGNRLRNKSMKLSIVVTFLEIEESLK